MERGGAKGRRGHGGCTVGSDIPTYAMKIAERRLVRI